MQTKLTAGYTSRPPTAADAEAINELICAVDVADYGEPDYSVDDLHADWQRKGFQLDRDAWMVFSPGGTFAAYGNVYDAGKHVRVDPTSSTPAQQIQDSTARFRLRYTVPPTLFLMQRIPPFVNALQAQKKSAGKSCAPSYATIFSFFLRPSARVFWSSCKNTSLPSSTSTTT